MKNLNAMIVASHISSTKGYPVFAEWEKQKGLVLIYPHRFCDFAPNLDEVMDCYDRLIAEVLAVEDLILVLHPDDEAAKDRAKALLARLGRNNYHLVELPSNDLWARDSLPISIKRGKNTKTVTNITNAILGEGKWRSENLGHFGTLTEREKDYEDDEYLHEFANFIFNGWGLKYPANLDNQLSRRLRRHGFFSNMKDRGLVLEGGSVDSNGAGLVLTTTRCLLEANRNPCLSQSEIEEGLKEGLGAHEILWLSRGFLHGDESTDGHIDTLARFIAPDAIAYVQCLDSKNLHYEELGAMERELEAIAKSHGLRLVALPLCMFEDGAGGYLPASYINFLFLNERRLIVPTYGKPTDSVALEIFSKALPDYEVRGLDCRALITQGGSLHCISMQFH